MAAPGLTAFMSRLHWHCHFIQKLESEPALEFRNLHRGYDGLREDDWNDAHFAALVAGRTGWPMVDACVAMLRETGWINFRMRAMLVSVASYPLWLHWRPWGCGWRGSFWTTSPASTGARCKCSRAPPASTPRASTTPSSRRKTTTRTALCAPLAARNAPRAGRLAAGALAHAARRAGALRRARGPRHCPSRWWTWRPPPAPPRPACTACAPSRGARGQGRHRGKARLAPGATWQPRPPRSRPPAANPGLLTHAHAQKARPAAESPACTAACLFTWRKKWEKVWDEVKYCSDRCRNERKRSGNAGGEGAA
jgi:hypothetical protein